MDFKTAVFLLLMRRQSKVLNIISEYVDTELSNHSNPQKTTKKKGKDAYER